MCMLIGASACARATSAIRLDPVDLGAQIDLIGAPEPMSIEAVLAVPNGGYLRTGPGPEAITLRGPTRGSAFHQVAESERVSRRPTIELSSAQIAPFWLEARVAAAGGGGWPQSQAWPVSMRLTLAPVSLNHQKVDISPQVSLR